MMRVLVSLLAMSLWFEVAGAQTFPQAVAPMEVVFLGTGVRVRQVAQPHVI